jgi:hypothetical protein
MRSTTDMTYSFDELSLSTFTDGNKCERQLAIFAAGRVQIEITIATGEWELGLVEIETYCGRERGFAVLEASEPLYALVLAALNQHCHSDIEADVQRWLSDIKADECDGAAGMRRDDAMFFAAE